MAKKESKKGKKKDKKPVGPRQAKDISSEELGMMLNDQHANKYKAEESIRFITAELSRRKEVNDKKEKNTPEKI